jgi:hypothetical protein
VSGLLAEMERKDRGYERLEERELAMMRDMSLSIDAAIQAFYEVREMRYAIDEAHDADSLNTAGAGDCLAKAELLARKLGAAGLSTRLVRWRYELPAVVPEIERLPSRLDLHKAVEVMLESRWLLVDATHDSPLGAGGLTVAEWSGTTETAPAYPVLGRRLVEGEDNDEIRAAQAEISTWVNSCAPEVLNSWRSAYLKWLCDIRPLPEEPL